MTPQDESSAEIPTEIAGRWRPQVVLKRDVFSTVERGRFVTAQGEVDAVLRRLDTVPWWSLPVARHLFGRERKALAKANGLGVGPELLYAGSPTRVFDHDTSKRIAAGNDNASAERVVVAIDRGTARMVDELMAMHRTMDTRLGQVVSAVGAQGQALTKLGDAIRVLAARAA